VRCWNTGKRFTDWLKGLGRRNSGLRPAALRSKLDYQAKGVMYLPNEARFPRLRNAPEGADTGKLLNEAMKAVERENEDLKDMLQTLKGEKLVLDWRKRQQSRAMGRLCIVPEGQKTSPEPKMQLGIMVVNPGGETILLNGLAVAALGFELDALLEGRCPADLLRLGQPGPMQGLQRRAVFEIDRHGRQDQPAPARNAGLSRPAPLRARGRAADVLEVGLEIGEGDSRRRSSARRQCFR